MVTIFVGKTKEPFYVHLDLLCDASSFFKAAFAGNFKEASEKTMQLPDDRESTFKFFVDWLYGRHDTIHQTISPAKEDDDKNDKRDRFFPAVCLFVLADKYNIYDLKTNIIEALIVGLRECKDYSLSYSTVTYAYENTAQGSRLRQLLAEFISWGVCMEKCKGTDFQALLKQQPDLAFEMITSLTRQLKGNQTRTRYLLKDTMTVEYPNKTPG